MAVVEATKPLREIPNVRISEDDKNSIRMMQLGAFLMAYNASRAIIEAGQNAVETAEQVQGVVNNVAEPVRDYVKNTPEYKGLMAGLDILKGESP